MTEGVNLVGFVDGERGQGASVRLGMSEILRRLSRGLECAGIPFTTVPYRPSATSAGRSAAPLREQAAYDTNVICLNADYLEPFLAEAGPGFFAGRTSVGVWFWETSTFHLNPTTALACLDEVWVASTYTRDAVSAAVDLPVLVAPLPMDVPTAPSRSRAELGLPEGFLFLFVFNFVSGLRKNPVAVVEAFKRAFEPNEGPVLALKSVNGRDRKPHLLAELEQAAAGRSDVVVLDRFVTDEDTRAMIASCDCYVSLHRSEGFGLTIAEAMALAKPVIATAYSGNLEFMDAGSSYLVPYSSVPVPTEWWAHSDGAVWAEPDVEAASVCMREVWESQAEARARAASARDSLLARFTVEHTANFLESRLTALQARGALVARASGHRAATLKASSLLLADVGKSLGSASRSRVATPARRMLRRALWPYLREQRELDAALLDAVTELQRSVENLELRIEGLESGSAQDRSCDEPA